ncbi:hypothetical protein [Nocardia terpenica]|uniref:Uncharacterized protein n=1 Tax=Nocardia terpenica TaxID=455432 RepID=A0A6G9ZDS9_9NOCA|nr:hypothetical protein [Nocardia terpenica]QIS23698.1 hypothetical protein F6W96_40900 [Nocardia terpenica]
MSAMRSRAVLEGISLMAPASLRVALSRWENGRLRPDEPYATLLTTVLELDTAPDVDTVIVEEPCEDTLFTVLSHHTDSLRLLDRRLGAPFVRRQTASHVSALETQWQRSAGADRRDVARALADAATLAAWQDFDVGDWAAAGRHYGQAKAAANRAGDPALLAHAVAEHAVVLCEIGYAELALAEVRRAEKFPSLPLLLRAWLAATRAQVASWCPGEEATVRHALTAADSALAHAVSGDDVALPYIALDEVHMDRWRGHVLARLGDPAASVIAEEALRRLPEDFVRARCAQVLDLAEGAAHAGEVEQAVALLASACEQIASLGSRRLMSRHDGLLRRVREMETSGV